jgi:CBS domain-containing protein
MANVRDILAKKGSHILMTGKDTSVLQAAILMNDHKIGALVVVDAGRVVGMFTERDILQRVVAGQRDPARTCVGDVMTAEVLCCTPQTSIEEARTVMKERRIRHLPVIDAEDRLQGLVSIGDLNAYEAASQEQTIFLMSEYIYGRV